MLIGSSPLARGTGCFSWFMMLSLRFILAGAGNISACAGSSRSTPVHPRWRGEQPVLFAGMDYVGGSSPLARGTEMFETSKRYAERFIPAGAGNSESGRHGDAKQPVHPRWRGEQVRCIAPSPAGRGSSPLARGTGCPGYGYFAAGRFIPAGAGNRGTTENLELTLEVHPRWRGEQAAGNAH